MIRICRRIVLVLAPFDIAFLIISAIGVPVPSLVRWAVGALILAAVVVEVASWCQLFSHQRRTGATARQAAARASRTIVGEPLWRLGRLELASLRSLLRWLARRPNVPSGARSLSYHRQLSAFLWVLVGVSVLELAVLHLLLPWQAARLVAVAIGAYGLVWVLGFRASMIINPHALTQSCLRIRHGATIDMPIPLTAIDHVVVRRHDCFGSKRAVQVVDAPETEDGATAQLAILSQTNVEITLREPLVAHNLADGLPVRRLRVFADDPESFALAATDALAASRAQAGTSWTGLAPGKPGV